VTFLSCADTSPTDTHRSTTKVISRMNGKNREFGAASHRVVYARSEADDAGGRGMPILQDQVVLVTGAGAGIGRGTALAMAEAGAAVAAADIDLAAAQRTAAQAAGNARRAIAIEVDCGDVASIDAMVARTVAELGRLDVIVNNAGVTRYAYIMDLTEADWDRIHRVNAKGVFFCLQRAAREMIGQGGGRIINIASIAGRGYAGTSNAAYAASKGAVIALTKTASQQLARHNINVNAICPGVTRTELGARNAAERAAERGITVAEYQAEADARIPIGRANQPEDIAAMAVFLASPGARNITGQAYNVDGGLVPS
jgi:NAD(P)-dependent dehydrogenase (short-subunit alcohol dehydrogenase family)